MFDLLFFIAIIPIIIIVLVIILVFILRNRNNSKYPQQSNISNKDYTSCNQSNGKSTVKQLLDLKKLYDDDILTEEEFNVQKNKILNS